MNVAYLSPFANHLWQSTLFACVAGVMTLGLQKNRARLRHWVWLAASCKFLIPFSVLIALGGHIRWRPAADTTPSNLSVVLAQVSQPFTAPTVPLPSLPTMPTTASQFPAVLWGIWGCGFLGITCSWWVRWRRIQATVRAASPLQLAIPVRAMSSSTSLEPGVFGVLRPVLLLPESIFERLTPAQIEAVIAHEMSHVRHWDNLIATVQMVVETVFWFHPLVWWIGKRMVEERERACDEEVLFLGSEPRVYAEGILNICKLYTESPLVCVSGVTGSNLKKRIETIMHNSVAVRLNFARRAVLAVAGIAALAAPIVVGMMNAPAVQAQSTATMPRFEVASIKPTSQEGPDVQGLGDVRMLPGGRLLAEKVLLRYFIQNAYGVKPFQISGGPAWINSAHYDIDAKAEGNPNNSQMRLMMQALLEDRFKLKLHHETKDRAVYELTAAKSGVKLQEPKEGSCISPDPNGPPLPPAPGQPIPCGRVLMMMSPSGARMQGGKVSMTELVRVLSNVLGRTVVDKTGFTATFDVHLEFTPDESLAGLPGPPPSPATPNDSTRPVPSPDLHGTIFAATQEQLGLKLESAKGPVDVLIIDSVEKPSAN
jgi:bla regulator protein blaR1